MTCGEFLAVLGVLHRPAERGDGVAQFVAALPVFLRARACARSSSERLHFGRDSVRVGVGFDGERAVDALPPFEQTPRVRGRELAFVERAVALA